MLISTKGRYALRMMCEIAQSDMGSAVPLKEIAQKQNISLKYLEQIVILLSRAGYVKSVRGAQGGYRLARDASSYTVGEILRTTEGNMAPVACLETPQNTCDRKNICSTLKVWEGLYKVVNDYLDSITLDQLVFENGVNNYVI